MTFAEGMNILLQSLSDSIYDSTHLVPTVVIPELLNLYCRPLCCFLTVSFTAAI